MYKNNFWIFMWFIWLKMKQNEKIFSGHSDCFVLSCYDIWHFWINFVNVLDLWGVWTCWISMVLAQVQQSQRHREEVHLLWTESLLCSKSRESDQLCVCGTSQNVCIQLRHPPPIKNLNPLVLGHCHISYGLN